MEKEIAFTLKDVQEELELSPKTLRKYIKTKQLPARKIGRQFYVTRAGLEKFIGEKE